MSSNTYSAEIYPDVLLRRFVLLSGCLLCIAGVALIAALPLPKALLIAGGSGWLARCVWELVTISRSNALCRGLRLTAAGDILLLDPDGNWQPARLLPGSVLLRRAGWIRLVGPKGRQFTELIRGRCRESKDWRRLQVIWRHVGATT